MQKLSKRKLNANLSQLAKKTKINQKFENFMRIFSMKSNTTL